MKIEIKQPGILYLSQAQYDIRLAVKDSTHHATQIARQAGVSYSTVQYITRGVHEPSEPVTELVLAAINKLNENPRLKANKKKKKRASRPSAKEFESRTGSLIYLTPRQLKVRTAIMESPFSVEAIAGEAGVSAITIRYWMTGLNEPSSFLYDVVMEAIQNKLNKVA